MPLCACLSSSPNHSLGIWKSLCLAPIATSGSFTPQVTGPLEVSKLSLLFLLTSTYGNCFSWGKKKSQWLFYTEKNHIFFGTFSFWKQNNAFKTLTFISRVSFKMFGFVSNAMKTAFETSGFVVKQTSSFSKSSMSRTSQEMHRQPTLLFCCCLGGKMKALLGC